MKRFSTLSIILLVCVQGAILAQSETIFNGKDLTGWTIYGTELWYAEDGLLVCESGPDEEYGYLGTDKKYKDFELTLEFKQGADGNSGVFIRSSIEGTKIAGWQAEVAPPGHNTGGIYVRLSGSDDLVSITKAFLEHISAENSELATGGSATTRRYQYFLFPALILFIAALILERRGL